ncbi:SDR family NAD(P)-dependent oxidoreductase [Lacisediminimonas sp.]|uniref:SDR family NAD(P)-dependent oxidoreductase n=1 Tax=Lacisediminimonas sp. TaxID=3060582 RepID=UPI0027188844|nr:SDR family NAD(P)-dependent oxidoreductase [Lacisediminimonas sp.]MDO8300685.1 SDR family NAD(P)-dependent oxidoreductase [Lacisediminimonas sp.]
MDLGLQGKVAIITGGARGIGLAHARALGREGAIIVINELDAKAAAQAVEELARDDILAVSCLGDAADEALVVETVAQVAQRFGRIDILVNNAGIGVKPAYPVENMPAQAWDQMIHVHMKSTFLWSREVIPHMKAGGFGRIVNTSSMNFTGGGRPGVAHYAAAKAGILGFTQTLSKEVGPFGITANAIAPGYVETDLIAQFSDEMRHRLTSQNPVGRTCQPSEVAALVAFLCSSQAGFINGEHVCIDGGRRDFYWGS